MAISWKGKRYEDDNITKLKSIYYDMNYEHGLVLLKHTEELMMVTDSMDCYSMY